MAGRVKGSRDKALSDFADNVVRLAKINLGKTFTAKNSKGKSYKKRIDASGNLRNSITSELKTTTKDGRFSKGFIIFKMLEYGLYVDKGRKAGTGVSKQGQLSIEKWIREKPLKMRDTREGKKGQFLKMTKSRVKGLAFVISRNIKNNGQKPTNFFTEPFEKQESKFFNQLQESIAQDNVDFISLQIDLINADSTQKS